MVAGKLAAGRKASGRQARAGSKSKAASKVDDFLDLPPIKKLQPVLLKGTLEVGVTLGGGWGGACFHSGFGMGLGPC